ncbi:hypothetical protein [Sphingobium sp.]|uniref:hypothetical protein n=1 Tax=Sphingobium sp. TaxID=1912891 RepID=UPI0028BF329D|nr:hypothetical protein [Sphingobium sp.]
MDPRGATSQSSECPTELHLETPRLSQWLWHRWYAKLWWKAAAIFWTACILEEAFVPRSFSQGLLQQYEGWIIAIVFLFHPFLILPVLGFGWLWALSNGPRGDAEDGVAGVLYNGSNGFGVHGQNMDPTNPADPRYVWHPGNPQSQVWLDTHVRGLR